jgi:hypothetical protein
MNAHSIATAAKATTVTPRKPAVSPNFPTARPDIDVLTVRHRFPDQRQNRGISELEQKEADGKDEDAPIFEESSATGPLGTRGVVIGSAARPGKMNIGGANLDEREEHRETQRGSREKDISGRKEVTGDTHDPGRGKAAC